LAGEEGEEASLPEREEAVTTEDLDVRRNETEEEWNGRAPPAPPKVRPTVTEVLLTAETFIALSLLSLLTLLAFSNQFNLSPLYFLSNLITNFFKINII